MLVCILHQYGVVGVWKWRTRRQMPLRTRSPRPAGVPPGLFVLFIIQDPTVGQPNKPSRSNVVFVVGTLFVYRLLINSNLVPNDIHTTPCILYRVISFKLMSYGHYQPAGGGRCHHYMTFRAQTMTADAGGPERLRRSGPFAAVGVEPTVV